MQFMWQRIQQTRRFEEASVKMRGRRPSGAEGSERCYRWFRSKGGLLNTNAIRPDPQHDQIFGSGRQGQGQGVCVWVSGLRCVFTN